MRRVITHIAAITVATLVVLLASLGLAFNNHNPDAPIQIGKTELIAAPEVVASPVEESEIPYVPPPPNPQELRITAMSADGNGKASQYNGTVTAPKDLKFFLVVGSDARPGQDVLRQRADSIHVAAVDPQNREGTVLGFPRDSWVNIPGHGYDKINAAMVYGGPDLLVRTIRDLTGFPIEYWAVTSFEGITKITNTLAGVDINVPYDMNDRYSGARFKKGWRHMNGQEVLAFSRARHGVPGGDFGRSENQGRVILHALEKMRHEVKGEQGIKNWLKVLYRYSHLNMSMKDAFELGKLARQIVPSDLKNIVAPGSAESRGGQSVVVLSGKAYELFEDIRGDAQADGNTKRGTPRPMPTPKPTPKPKPKATPSPTPPGGGLLPLPTPPR